MIPMQIRDEFWKVVEDCLEEFHQYASPDARTSSETLRRQIEAAPIDLSTEAVYHDEPFDVACDIARRPLDLHRHRARYDAILGRRHW